MNCSNLIGECDTARGLSCQGDEVFRKCTCNFFDYFDTTGQNPECSNINIIFWEILHNF